MTLRPLLLTTMTVGLLLAARAGGPVASPYGVPAATLDALRAAGVTDPNRALLHVGLVCTLDLGDGAVGVYDLREIVPHTPSPRGVNHIALLNARGEVVQALRYADERPLRCAGDRLLLWAPLDPYDGQAAGNVLIFSEGGRAVRTAVVPIDTLPEGLTAPLL